MRNAISAVLRWVGCAVACVGFCLVSERFWWLPIPFICLGGLTVLAGVMLAVDKTENEEDEKDDQQKPVARITDFQQVYLLACSLGKDEDGSNASSRSITEL